MKMRHHLLPSLFAAAALAVTAVGPASAYPTKPITMVVPFAPGGGSDIVGRLVAEALGKELGQTVVVDNRSGAGGTVGIAYLSKTKPDGYSIGLANTSTQAIGPLTLPNVPYDPVKDFVPIAIVAETPYVIAVPPKLKAKSLPEFIALAKAQPGKFNYGSAGAGSTTHLASANFVDMAGLKMEHIAYKGNGPAAAAVMTGEIEMLMGTLPSLLNQIRAGSVRALAVTGTSRSAEVPELPTVQESGVAGYEASIWYGMVAPAGTPDDVVKRLNEAVAKVLQDEELRKRIRAAGAEAMAIDAAGFAKRINEDIEKFRKVVKDIGFTVN